MSSLIVDTVDLVRQLIERIQDSTLKDPLLFLDLEGTELSRHGSIAIMQVLIPPEPTVFLLDIEVLRERAFETKGPSGSTLKSILESNTHPKVLFDVRNESDALYSLYHINLRCTVDIQLLEFATRPSRGRFLKGLAKCISEDGRLSVSQSNAWQSVKDAGSKLFAPEKGGSYEVFHLRPLQTAVLNYCVQDVLLLPVLLTRYAERLSAGMASQVQSETERRITLSQSPEFNGKGRHMAIGPAFTWRRNTAVPLYFPMSVILSADLAQNCNLNKSANLTEDIPGQRELPSTTSNRIEAQQITNLLLGATVSSTVSTDNGLSSEPGDRAPLETPALNDDGFGSDYVGEDRYLQGSGRLSSESQSPRDYTACSSEDCGYCGKCDY